MDQRTFDVGLHRPVYLWAGPGTIRMNRLKFMGAPVDEAVHAEAHQETGARRMAEEADFNWAYLTYDWGFPPEIERQDWDEFCRAVEIYHHAGMRVWGYVQASNCVYDGSYRTKEWYALDPRGKPFHYYTGRYMTCWRHPEWREHLEAMTRGVIEAGADGVFYDNPWHGSQPLHLGGAWLGPAGCYCPRCRAAYHQATGAGIPAHLAPDRDEASRLYLRWRAGEVTATLSALAGHARSLRPDVAISVNDFDAVMRPSTLVYGIDLPSLAAVQDVIMIEDYGLPRWQLGSGDDHPANGALLVNNALTLRTARALCGTTPISTNPYDKGIGFDGVYSPRRLRQGIAEAAACGAAMVTKGTEFVEDGVFTLLTAEAFGPQRQAIGGIHRWLAAEADVYRGRSNEARVGLLYPAAGLWPAWDRLAPGWFAAGQALLAAGVPWRVVPPGGDWTGLETVLCFDDRVVPPGLRAISVPDLPGWCPPEPSFLARHDTIRRAVATGAGSLFAGYFRSRTVRQIIDRLGLVHFFWQTPFFRLPGRKASDSLLAAVGDRPYPRVTAGSPVLVEIWRQGSDWQLHLVNYDEAPQQVSVDWGREVEGQILSPDVSVTAGTAWRGDRTSFILDVYAVLRYRAVSERL